MDIYTLNENCMAREIDLLHNSAIRYDVAKKIYASYILLCDEYNVTVDQNFLQVYTAI